MRVVTGTPWRLEEAENLRALSVIGREGLPGRIEDDHAWLDIAALRAAGPQDEGWLEGFAAMITYARTRGWVRGDAVRAHFEQE